MGQDISMQYKKLINQRVALKGKQNNLLKTNNTILKIVCCFNFSAVFEKNTFLIQKGEAHLT